MARQLLVYGAIAYSVAFTLSTTAWLAGVISGAALLHLVTTLGLAAPLVLVVAALLASLEDKAMALRFVGQRRIWLGTVALALIAGPTSLASINAGAAHQIAFLPMSGLIAILALFCIGFGIAEVLGRDPLELFRMNAAVVIQKFITALNDGDKHAAMELVQRVPLHDPLSWSYHSSGNALRRHAAEERRSRIELNIDRAVRGRSNLTARPADGVGFLLDVEISGDIGGRPVSEDAHVQVTWVDDDGYWISHLEL